jgi:hypothetical protein
MKKIPETVVLNNGRIVKVTLLNSVRIHIKKSIASMKPHHKFTLKEACAAEYWMPMSNWLKRQAGWCMKHLVDTKELPVNFIEQKSNKSLLYQKVE